MNIYDAMPSKWLKAADLKGQPVEVIINDFEFIEGEKDVDRIIGFVGKKKKLGLNITNTKKIGEIHGEETDNWSGKKIELYPTTTEMAGKTTPCIRIRAVKSAEAAAEAEKPGDF